VTQRVFQRGLPILLALILSLSGIAIAKPETNIEKLQELSRRYEQALAAGRTPLFYELRALTDGPQGNLNHDPDIELMFLGPRGKPFFYAVENEIAAQTLSTDEVWPGGSGGFSITGADTPLGRLAVWDAGGVRLTHDEYEGRVTQMDSPSGTHYHSTHVAGTLVAGGVDPAAIGMSHDALLAAYDWNSDESEMAAAAASDGMSVSSHSYGYVTGWYYSSSGDYYWYGDVDISPVEDYGFGFYGSPSEDLDQIACDAPYYLICKSAGNDRNDYGPGPGGGHYYWDGGGWEWSTDTRDPDGGTTGYDTVNWKGTAKNIMTVGAIDDIPGGYTQPSDVVMSSFSNWGPTDDGRIKPDLVANGIGLYSCGNDADNDYATYSGTSMASPNLAGSLNLLVEYYENTHGSDLPLAATLKALAIGTADEAGSNPGPDYEFGWGLMNTLRAIELIQADSAAAGHIREETLAQGATDSYYFTHSEAGDVRLTIVWTDPPGTPPPDSLDPPDLMLVNDLDVRLVETFSSATYEPWILDPANPSDAATTGDNVRDNVEQIHVDNLPVGSYRVDVSHKSSLSPSGEQDYSLVSTEALADTPPGTGIVTIVEDVPELPAPSVQPNPFRTAAVIEYGLASSGPVEVSIFDVQGRLVRTLEREDVSAPGIYRVQWNGHDAAGRQAPSGVYFARVRAGALEQAVKIVLLRTE
jgi:hypothetical protein